VEVHALIHIPHQNNAPHAIANPSVQNHGYLIKEGNEKARKGNQYYYITGAEYNTMIPTPDRLTMELCIMA
jgi:hypothetical protein